MTPLRKLLTLSLPATALAFTLAETIARTHLPAPAVDHIVRTGEYDPVYHHQFRADPRRVKPREPGVPRLLFVGDSFAEGAMTLGGTIPRQTKRLFRNELEQDTFVLNLGTSSYSPLLEALLVENVGLKTDPDLVVLMVDESDVQDDAIYERMAVFEDGVAVAVNPRALRPANWLLHSRLISSALLTWTLARGDTVAEYTARAYDWRGGPPSCAAHDVFCFSHRMSYNHHERPAEYWEPHYARTLGYVGRIVERCRAAGVPLLLVLYPYPAALDTTDHSNHFRERYGYPTGRLASRFRPHAVAWAAENGVPLFDFHDFIAAYEDISALYPGHDSHYNKLGNELFARELFARIVRGIDDGDWLPGLRR